MSRGGSAQFILFVMFLISTNTPKTTLNVNSMAPMVMPTPPKATTSSKAAPKTNTETARQYAEAAKKGPMDKASRDLLAASPSLKRAFEDALKAATGGRAPTPGEMYDAFARACKQVTNIRENTDAVASGLVLAPPFPTISIPSFPSITFPQYLYTPMVDYTDHGYSDNHTAPHWHERVYEAQHPEGQIFNHRTDPNPPFNH